MSKNTVNLTNGYSMPGGSLVAATFGPTATPMTYDDSVNGLGEVATMPAPSTMGGAVGDKSHTTAYMYDSRNELTSEIATPISGTGSTFGYSESFADDLAFNPTTLRGNALGFNTDNQNSNASLFGYDGDGNPVNYESSSQNFMFDPEDRLTAMSSPVFAAHYDGDGIRDIRTLGTNTTYYLDVGGSPLLEESYSGTTTTVNFAHGYADGWRETYSNGIYYVYGYDPEGNLVDFDESDNNDGSEPYTTECLYDGFGKKVFSGIVGPDTRNAFSASYGGQYGYYTDLSTGLALLGHRYYDGGTGRFINRDPTGTNGGINPNFL